MAGFVVGNFGFAFGFGFVVGNFGFAFGFGFVLGLSGGFSTTFPCGLLSQCSRLHQGKYSDGSAPE